MPALCTVYQLTKHVRSPARCWVFSTLSSVPISRNRTSVIHFLLAGFTFSILVLFSVASSSLLLILLLLKDNRDHFRVSLTGVSFVCRNPRELDPNDLKLVTYVDTLFNQDSSERGCVKRKNKYLLRSNVTLQCFTLFTKMLALQVLEKPMPSEVLFR